MKQTLINFYVQINSIEEIEKLILILSYYGIKSSSRVMERKSLIVLPYYIYRFKDDIDLYTGERSTLIDAKLIEKEIDYFYTL